MIKVTRRGVTFNAEVIKRANLSNGHDIFLLRDLNSPSLDRYIVAVNHVNDGTKEFYRYPKLNLACLSYLDFVCFYA